METCLGDLNLHWCIIYLDDMGIISKDLASHLERLEAVFWKLEEAGLKLKPSKCELFQWQLTYQGHVISAKGAATHKGKIDAIKNWPTPTNIMEVQTFLGFMGYYHWFIPKFMQVAWPLHELTSGENAGKKKAAMKWDSRCQQAFDDLKRLCTMASILAYEDFTKPFKLHTHACGSGLWAVLCQTHEDGTLPVIVYASRNMSKAESHLSSTQVGISHLQMGSSWKILWMLVWLTFSVYTDNDPFNLHPHYSQAGCSQSSMGCQLGQVQFLVALWAGKANINADDLWYPGQDAFLITQDHILKSQLWAVQEATLKGPSSPIKAYSYDLHILDAVQDSQQVTCMTLEDWHQA